MANTTMPAHFATIAHLSNAELSEQCGVEIVTIGRWRKRIGYVHPQTQVPWPAWQDAALCEAIAEGATIAAAGAAAGVTWGQAAGRFKRIRASFGRQGL